MENTNLPTRADELAAWFLDSGYDGRTFCVPEDFKPLVVPVFAHRVVVNGNYSSALKKSEQAEQVMREIVESVPIPV